MILKDLRKVDDKIASKTSEEYNKFISRLESDISYRSNEVIMNVMRKVKLGTVDQ